MGGEITWTCLTSGANAGKVVFRVTLYRDCGGISTPGTSLNLSSNSPVSFIVCARVAPGLNVSPSCYLGQLPCSGPTGNGSIEQHVFQSDPITLNGTPPPTGWVFYYEDCCRPNGLLNMQNSSSQSLRLRAVMRPFSPGGQSMNMYPCYDSSPNFAEAPVSVICSGYTHTYTQNAVDADLDEMEYSLTAPLGSNGIPIANTGGFTWTQPFPSNPGMQFNNITGNISISPQIGGSYVSSVKIETRRCGQIIAEVYRDIPLIIRTSCPPIITNGTGTVNLPPNVVFYNYSGYDSIKPVYTANGNVAYWKVKVLAGEKVKFRMVASEGQLLPNLMPQSIDCKPLGPQFGSPLSSASTGCLNTPCATLVPATGQPSLTGVPFQNSVIFEWQTDCNHLATASNSCGQSSNLYPFFFRMTDNYCPVPASEITNVIVEVLDSVPDAADLTNTCVKNKNGKNQFTWAAPIDTCGAFVSYQVYHSSSYQGPYTCLDTITNYGQTNFEHTNPDPDLNLYYITTEGMCGINAVSSTIINDLRINQQPSDFTAYSATGWANFICKSASPLVTYQWQQNNGLGWTNIQNFGIYGGATSDSLIINGVSPSMNNYGYRCIISNCTKDTSSIALLSVVNGLGQQEIGVRELIISPNPSESIFRLNYMPLGTYELYSMKGEILEKGFDKQIFDLTNLEPGLYVLRLATEGGIHVFRLIKT